MYTNTIGLFGYTVYLVNKVPPPHTRATGMFVRICQNIVAALMGDLKLHVLTVRKVLNLILHQNSICFPYRVEGYQKYIPIAPHRCHVRHTCLLILTHMVYVYTQVCCLPSFCTHNTRNTHCTHILELLS